MARRTTFKTLPVEVKELWIDGVQVTATAAEINNAADTSANMEVVTATNVITAAETGKTFFLSAATGFLSTLPAPAIGLNYTFIVKTSPTSNGYTIGTPTADIIIGMVLERAGTAGVSDANADLVTLVANQSIKGDWLKFVSDGTSWFMHGMVDVATGVTTATT